MTQPKRDLVTGGAGFIGSHLVDRLLAAGRRVRVVDSFVTGGPRNLAHLKGEARLEVVQADVRERARMTELAQGCERVFHLAALADIVPSVERPEAYFDSNVTGTFNVLQAARAAGAARFVYAASSSCYGIPDLYPTPETSPIRPQYPYALTKYLGEETVLHWGQVYGLSVASLRFFNVYGPRARTSGTYGAVFGVFLAQLLAGRPLTVVGDGTQSRDFVFVGDVAEALATTADSAVAGVALNVGTGRDVAINRLVELLGAAQVAHIPKRPGEPERTCADVARIERLTGWHARTSFEEGVAVMRANIDYWRDAPVWTAERIAEATRDWFRYLGRED